MKMWLGSVREKDSSLADEILSLMGNGAEDEIGIGVIGRGDLMEQTYLSLWGVWLFPPRFRDYSLHNIRDWARREDLSAEEGFVAQGVLEELGGFYPGCRRVGVLVRLHRDPAGRLSHRVSYKNKKGVEPI